MHENKFPPSLSQTEFIHIPRFKFCTAALSSVYVWGKADNRAEDFWDI